MRKPPKDPYSKKAIAYAKSVISGKIEACWQIKAACQRFLDDLQREDILYRSDYAVHACEFAEEQVHVIGPLTGEKINLAPFQVLVFVNLFGFVDAATNLRKYKEAFLLFPRGSAKSTIAAIIGNYMTFCLDQGGAEGLSGATSMQQAEAVFVPAKRMLEMNPECAEALGIEVNARSIYQASTGSSFRPVIAKTKDGGLPWIAIADELHQALDSTQLDAFRTGMGKRRGSDPLLLIISTAGTNVAGVCRQEQLYFENVLKGTVKDDSKFALIYTIDPTDDWRDFKVWKKANPAYGISVDEKHLRDEYEKAKQSPSYQATALTKYLNVWQNTGAGWLNTLDWSKAAAKDLQVPTSARCWIGVDLSTKIDLTAVSMVFEMEDGNKGVIPHLFLPEGALERSKNAKAYVEWIASGDLEKTQGSASNHQLVEQRIRDLCATYNVQAVYFDVYQAAGMMQRLQVSGIECVEFPQTAINMNQPMIDFEADLLNGKIAHPDNECLNWMALNATVRQRGNLQALSKPQGQDHLKIDGMIATLMAFAGSNTEAPQEKSYEVFVLD